MIHSKHEIAPNTERKEMKNHKKCPVLFNGIYQQRDDVAMRPP